jgi:ankyrin repeat protein
MTSYNDWNDEECHEEFQMNEPNPALNYKERIILDTIYAGDIDKLEHLLESGEKGHFCGLRCNKGTQCTPLQACLCHIIRTQQGLHQTLRAMRLLIKYGANVNYSGVLDGTTVMSDAVGNNDADVVDFLVVNGADVNKLYGIPLNKSGSPDRTLLFHCRRASIAKTLIERGANVNAKESYGLTPLHFMCLWGKHVADSLEEVLDMLLFYGADKEARTNIQKHGPYGSTPLLLALLNDSEELAIALVSRGVDIQAHNLANHQTVLHIATKKNMVRFVELLFNGGVIDNYLDERGWRAVDECTTNEMEAVFQNVIYKRQYFATQSRREAIAMAYHARLGVLSMLGGRVPADLIGKIARQDNNFYEEDFVNDFRDYEWE